MSTHGSLFTEKRKLSNWPLHQLYRSAFDTFSSTSCTTIGQTCTRVTRPSGRLQRGGDSRVGKS